MDDLKIKRRCLLEFLFGQEEQAGPFENRPFRWTSKAKRARVQRAFMTDEIPEVVELELEEMHTHIYIFHSHFSVAVATQLTYTGCTPMHTQL